MLLLAKVTHSKSPSVNDRTMDPGSGLPIYIETSFWKIRTDTLFKSKFFSLVRSDFKGQCDETFTPPPLNFYANLTPLGLGL